MNNDNPQVAAVMAVADRNWITPEQALKALVGLNALPACVLVDVEAPELSEPEPTIVTDCDGRTWEIVGERGVEEGEYYVSGSTAGGSELDRQGGCSVLHAKDHGGGGFIPVGVRHVVVPSKQEVVYNQFGSPYRVIAEREPRAGESYVSGVSGNVFPTILHFTGESKWDLVRSKKNTCRTRKIVEKVV